MITIAVITLSDKGAAGQREDKSGQVVCDMVRDLGEVVYKKILPDEKELIIRSLTELSDKGVQLVLTTGGTGLSPRDVTPEATLEVADREIPGIAEVMRYTSLSKTPHAMLSRSVAVVRKNTLIINLPGSPKAASENLKAVLPALEHAVKKINGDMTECACHE